MVSPMPLNILSTSLYRTVRPMNLSTSRYLTIKNTCHRKVAPSTEVTIPITSIAYISGGELSGTIRKQHLIKQAPQLLKL